jgi:hypothetical protein
LAGSSSKKFTKQCQALINLVHFSYLPLLVSASFILVSFSFFRSFVFVVFSFLSFCFSNSLGHHQSNFPIRSGGIFLSLSSLDPFFLNFPIPNVLRSNASLLPNWRCRFHAQISASHFDPANVIAQEGGNASPAMNQVLTRTTARDRLVLQPSPASMRINPESVSNEIDESDPQE